jgi:hypothetical protein
LEPRLLGSHHAPSQILSCLYTLDANRFANGNHPVLVVRAGDDVEASAVWMSLTLVIEKEVLDV